MLCEGSSSFGSQDFREGESRLCSDVPLISVGDVPRWNLALLLLNELFHSLHMGTSRGLLQGMPASFTAEQLCSTARCTPSHWEWFSENPEICTYNQPLRHVLSFSTSSPHMHCSRQSRSQELWIINHNNSFSIASQGRGRISTSLAYCVCHSPLAWFIRRWRWRHRRAEVGHLRTPRCTVPGWRGPDTHDVSQLRAHHYFSTTEHVRRKILCREDAYCVTPARTTVLQGSTGNLQILIHLQ